MEYLDEEGEATQLDGEEGEVQRLVEQLEG